MSRRTTTSVQVPRTKLIEILEARLAEFEGAVESNLAKSLKEEISKLEKDIKKSTARLAKLKTVKSVNDLPNEYPFYRFKDKNGNSDLKKQINLLKLSEQEVLLVSPTSNLYSYL